MTSEGFTEDDQARIAEDVLGRVGAKRSGLGFSADAQAATATAFASSSGWFDQRAESTSKEHAVGTHDTTEGPFAWGAGQREKAGGAIRKTVPSRANSDSPSERDFPMVRDRDIEKAARGGQSSRRRRSRSRSKDDRNERAGRRDSRRSRSRSNGRERRDAARRIERQREREKELQRQRTRERDRQRKRETNRRSRSPTFRENTERHRSKGFVKVSGPVPMAERTKAAVKQQLRKATVKDATLKTGAISTVGGGAGWERPEMSMASDFFTRDEISSKGGVASVAPEYEARLAEILQVEDEDTMSLRQDVPPSVASGGSIGPPGLDPSTHRHHDAIFAPTLTVSEANTHVPRPLAALAPVSRSVGVVGAAARARLMLSGKLKEDKKPSSEPAPASAKKTSKKSVKHLQSREDDSKQPLFKALRVGETVEAHYTADDRWYKANILQTIHSGFEIARYKVRYDQYGNEETIGWTRIRRLEHTSAECLSATEDEVELQIEDPKAEATARAEETLLPFAGMRPRQTRTDIIPENHPPGASPATDEKIKMPQVGDVVNPALRSVTAGRKMSWKDRVAAKKAGGQPGVVAAGERPKQISLVPDFTAQKREPADTAMDTSEWRTKVVFGMGSSKKR